jgi:cation transport regulator ChaC
MTLYFAYGSNLHRAAMQARCPGARALGPARLDSHRFFIGVDGWGSVKPSPGETVHGVLWRLTPRDLAALHAYELLHKGLYDVRHLPVRMGRDSGGRRALAMLYVLRRRYPGRPKPGYAELCAAAARSWQLPERYVREVSRWSTSRWTGSRAIDGRELI